MVLSLCMCLFFLNFLPSSLPLSLAALNLCCCAVCLVVESEGYFSLQCTGFLLRWLLSLRSTGSRHASFSSCSTWASAVHGSVKPGTTVGLQPSRLPPPQPHSPHVCCLRGLQTRLAPPLSTLDPTRSGSVISAPTQTGSLPRPHPAEKRETCCWEMSLHQGVSGEVTSPAFTIHCGPQKRGFTEALRGPSFLPSSVPHSPILLLLP